jgi:hypothetical protein
MNEVLIASKGIKESTNYVISPILKPTLNISDLSMEKVS